MINSQQIGNIKTFNSLMGGLATNTDAEGSEVPQSITENGQKIIHINSTLNDGFIDLGLTCSFV